MKRLIGMMLLAVGASSVALAIPSVPEIDPGSGMSALALLSGIAMVFRGRRRR